MTTAATWSDRYERMLMELTRYELGGYAEFLDGQSAFRLKSCPFPGTDSGQALDEDQAHRLLRLPARDCHTLATPPASEPLASLTALRQEAILKTISQRNATFFEAEANKLDGWADDLKAGLEREIKELDRQIREARRNCRVDP